MASSTTSSHHHEDNVGLILISVIQPRVFFIPVVGTPTIVKPTIFEVFVEIVAIEGGGSVAEVEVLLHASPGQRVDAVSSDAGSIKVGGKFTFIRSVEGVYYAPLGVTFITAAAVFAAHLPFVVGVGDKRIIRIVIGIEEELIGGA